MKRNQQFLIVVAVVIVAVIAVFLIGRQKTGEQPVQPTGTGMSQTTSTTPKGPDTVVPAGMSPEEYLNKYYQAYKDQQWKEAYAMLPAERKSKESYDQYVATYSGMPLDEFTVKPAEIDGNNAVVAVEIKIGGTGEAAGMLLQINWSFTKKNGKWIAEATKTMIR